MVKQINIRKLGIIVLFCNLLLSSCSNELDDDTISKRKWYYSNYLDNYYKNQTNEAYSIRLHFYTGDFYLSLFFEKKDSKYFFTKYDYNLLKIFSREIDSLTFNKITTSLAWLDNNKYSVTCNHNSEDTEEMFIGQVMYEYVLIKYSSRKFIYMTTCNGSKDQKNGLLHDETASFLLSIIAETELNPELYTKVASFEEVFPKEIIEQSQVNK